MSEWGDEKEPRTVSDLGKEQTHTNQRKKPEGGTFFFLTLLVGRQMAVWVGGAPPAKTYMLGNLPLSGWRLP